MDKERIHAELLQSLDKPETIKKMLLNPKMFLIFLINHKEQEYIKQ